MAENNVIARKQPAVPEGVVFPLWLWRADGRSVQANNPKEYGDFMRAGYISADKIPMAVSDEPSPVEVRKKKRKKKVAKKLVDKAAE